MNERLIFATFYFQHSNFSKHMVNWLLKLYCEINERTTAISSFTLCSLQVVKKSSKEKFFDTSSYSTSAKAEDVK